VPLTCQNYSGFAVCVILRYEVIVKSNAPIALLTDFGTRDTYVGSLKAAIYDVAPDATLIDICHDITPQNILEGAFVLRMIFADYPKGTIFVGVVDPGVGSERQAILISAGGYKFIGPDNGIFSYPLTMIKVDQVISLDNDKFFRTPVSTTFHGRDIFAPCAAALCAGATLKALGTPLKGKPHLLDLPIPQSDNENTLQGQVMRSDHFGNLITNIHRHDFEKVWPKVKDTEIKIKVVDWDIPLSPIYAHKADDPLCAVWGSTGFLEIASRNGSARDMLDIIPAEPVILSRSS